MAIWERGRRIRDYTLVELLARGGMGELWRATRAGFEGRSFALKAIIPELAGDERWSAMFMAESRLAARLNHPNIVNVYDFGKDGDQLWFAMEFVDGKDLRYVNRASGGGVPSAHALFVLGETLKALRYLHEQRDPEGRPLDLVHRDVKPGNILVAADGYVKLADFGIAKVKAESTVEGAGTGTGQVKGTAGYLAPELLRGAEATASSDLYALGVMAWETFAGRRLFTGNKTARDFEIPRLTNVHPRVEDWVRTLLAKDPADRFETTAAAAAACRGLPGARDSEQSDVREYLANLAAVPEEIEDAHAMVAQVEFSPSGFRAPARTASSAAPTGDTVGGAVGEVSGIQERRTPRARRLVLGGVVGVVAVGALVATALWNTERAKPNAMGEPAASPPDAGAPMPIAAVAAVPANPVDAGMPDAATPRPAPKAAPVRALRAAEKPKRPAKRDYGNGTMSLPEDE